MTKGDLRGYVLQPGAGRPIGRGEHPLLVKADGELTGGAFSLIETHDRGVGPPLHIHRDAAEAFYVLDGEYVMVLDGNEFVCPAGSFVFVPAGTAHTFRMGPMLCRKFNLYVPAAMVGYFEELIDASMKGVADAALVSELAARYHMEVLEQIPEGYV